MKMKKSICFLSGILCLFLASGCVSEENDSSLKGNISVKIQIEKAIQETMPDEIPSDETLSDGLLSDEELSEGEMEPWNGEKPAYVDVYTEFLLHGNLDSDEVFPVRGYYLMDLNFDNIPELGILHDSYGSMGGYFTYYYFDGNEIKRVLNDKGEQARASSYTQVLADFEYKKIYLLKEMYLLSGNVNGTYGYVREIKSKGQVPCVYDILNLEVDQESDLMSHSGSQHKNEDEFLSDPELDECLITQRYMENEWVDISSEEYRIQKRKLIPEENSFVELRKLGFDYHGINCDDEGNMLYTDVRMEKEEIDKLFRRFVQSL